MSPYNLVSVTVHCPNVFLYSDFNWVHRSYFKQDSPARAFIETRSLLFRIFFEMQVIAVNKERPDEIHTDALVSEAHC